MINVDLANAMDSNLKSSKESSSHDFKLKIILELLNNASSCFEKANKADAAEKITSLMEKLSSKA